MLFENFVSVQAVEDSDLHNIYESPKSSNIQKI